MQLVFKIEMNPSVENRPIRPWVLTIPLLLVIVGLLVAIATPNFVRSGPSKINCIINVLRNVDAAKEQWAVEHGYTNNIPLSREITAQDMAPYLYPGDRKEFFVRLGLSIDKHGNLRNSQDVVFVINPLGIFPEARFTKAFKLSHDESFIGSLFSPKIPRGTVMRFSTNTNAQDSMEYVLPGQESKPYTSLSDLLAR